MSAPEQHRYWKLGDRRFSFFTSNVAELKAAGATLESDGWTVAHPDGTRGLGRPPFATREAAQAWCDANPYFPGMSQG
jgi:hypothetical protein